MNIAPGNAMNRRDEKNTKIIKKQQRRSINWDANNRKG